MPAPPLAPVSDDMQGECFRTPSFSRRVTQCPLFPPVQHLFTAAGGDPSTLKAPVRSYTDFTNVEGWADTQARGIPRLEPPLAALLCPGAGWRPNEMPLPPDRLQKQIVGLTDRVFVCASQSAAAVNNIALLSSAMVSLSADREFYGPEEAARWLAVSRFSSAILQLCQPIAVSAGRHMAWATMIQRVIWLSHTAVPERERASLVQGPLAPDGLFGPWFSEVLAHQQSVRENRSRSGAILTGSSRQQAGRKRGPGRSQCSRGPPPTPAPVQQQQQPPQTGRAAPRTGNPVAVGWRSDGVFTWPLVHLLLRSRCFLEEPVDTAACTGLLVPHIIASTSLQQFVGGEETGPCAVATACRQRMRTAVGSPSLGPLCVLARALCSAIVVGHHVEMGPSHTVQASPPTL
ncbi:unnamed protein product [Boreogadus saida]